MVAYGHLGYACSMSSPTVPYISSLNKYYFGVGVGRRGFSLDVRPMNKYIETNIATDFFAFDGMLTLR